MAALRNNIIFESVDVVQEDGGIDFGVACKFRNVKLFVGEEKCLHGRWYGRASTGANVAEFLVYEGIKSVTGWLQTGYFRMLLFDYGCDTPQ